MKEETVQSTATEKRVVYTNKNLMEMFDVSARTISRWRNDGWLGFSHIGDQYYYTEHDISQFLSRSHVNAFA